MQKCVILQTISLFKNWLALIFVIHHLTLQYLSEIWHVSKGCGLRVFVWTEPNAHEAEWTYSLTPSKSVWNASASFILKRRVSMGLQLLQKNMFGNWNGLNTSGTPCYRNNSSLKAPTWSSIRSGLCDIKCIGGPWPKNWGGSNQTLPLKIFWKNLKIIK